MDCPDISRFNVPIKAALNPNCLDPRPQWPQGNNGQQTSGIYVFGNATTGPPESNTGPDNQLDICVQRTQWDENTGASGAYVNQSGCESVIVPANFYTVDQLTGTLTEQLQSILDSLNEKAFGLKRQILDFSVTALAASNKVQVPVDGFGNSGCQQTGLSPQGSQPAQNALGPTLQELQFSSYLGSAFVQDDPNQFPYPGFPTGVVQNLPATAGVAPLCYIEIKTTGSSTYVFAGAATGSAQITGKYVNPTQSDRSQNIQALNQTGGPAVFNNGTDVFTQQQTGTWPTGFAVGPQADYLTGIFQEGSYINNFTLMPDFTNYPEKNDLQVRSGFFNPAGILTTDNTTQSAGIQKPINYSEPPWVQTPGYGLSWEDFQNAILTGSTTGTTCLFKLATNVCSNGVFTNEMSENFTAGVPPGTEGLTYLQPINGQCQRRPDQDPCLNPCIRDPNSGQLQPNSQVSQCRVFPNLSDANPRICPTVCPKQCVEMWETCPEGTGLLTTLQNVLGPADVMSLQGPYLANGQINKSFPFDRNGDNQTAGPWPNPNKPQKECYAFGTQFCELALGNIQPQPPLASGSPQPSILCAAPCPNGFINLEDFCTGTNLTNFVNVCTGSLDGNPWNQSEKLLGPFFNGAQICVPSNGDFNNVLCDPNQFQPWQGVTGMNDKIVSTKVQGCATKPLNVLQGTTCPQKTTSQVNELFSLEWCLNACSENTLIDPSNSTCIATCEGAIWDSSEEYIVYWDYQDAFQTGNHCVSGTVCTQSNRPGACPGKIYKPENSYEQVSSVQNHGLLDSAGQLIQSKIVQSSLPKSLPFDDSLHGLSKKQQSLLRDTIEADQKKQNINPDQFTQCPPGMEIAVQPQNGELIGHCQDTCLPGFKPIRICKNNQLTNINLPINEDISNCPEADLIQACLPDCPPNWDEDNRIPGVYNCTYKYPGQTAQSFPDNPIDWKTCPLDGKYLVVEQTTTQSTNSAETSAGNYGPALCIRSPYLRLNTCPVGMYEDPVTKVCTKLCTSNDIYIYRPTGPVCVRACSADGRYNQDQNTLQDPNIDPKFADRQCSRQATNVGAGSDMNLQPTAKQESNTANNVALGSVGVGIVIVLVVIMIFVYRS